MKKRVTRMEERGIEQDKKARIREYIIISLIVLIPILAVISGVIWGMLHHKIEYYISDGTTEKSIVLSNSSVEQACEALGFKDVIITKQEQSGDKIIVKVSPALHATIKSKNTSITTRFTECTVRELLEEKGFTFDDKDEITPPLDTRLKEDAQILIIDVEYQEIDETEQTPFEIENKENSELLKGKQKIIQYGVYGEKKVTYRVKLEDGEQTEKEIISEEVIKEPVNCVVEQGTKEPTTEQEKQEINQSQENDTKTPLTTTTTTNTNNTSVQAPKQQIINSTNPEDFSTAGRAYVWSVPAGIQDDTVNKIITAGDGSSYEYTGVIDVKATAYNRVEDGGLVTATGTITQYGTIAVDPSIIPLGTKLYVVSDGGQSWSYGPGLAEDTGGLIKGNKIDLFFMTGEEATEFGVRSAKVYILKD